MGANVSATRIDHKGQRVIVRLDPGILVEALILQRLNTVPKSRHQDWIRSLLVQGFLSESRVFRQLNGTESKIPVAQHREQQSPRSGFDFNDWIGPSASPKPAVKATSDILKEHPATAVKRGTSDKPFAHLRKVVG